MESGPAWILGVVMAALVLLGLIIASHAADSVMYYVGLGLCAFGVLWMTPWVLWEVAHGTRVLLSPRGLLAVAYSAIGSLLLAYAGWSYVVTRLGAARAGVTMHLMPALGVLMAVVFLDEVPHWFHFAGIALILSGVALSSSRPRTAAA